MSPDESNSTPTPFVPQPRKSLTADELARWVYDPDFFGAFCEIARPVTEPTGYYSIGSLCAPECPENHEHITEPAPQYRHAWLVIGPAGDDTWYRFPDDEHTRRFIQWIAATLAALITQLRPQETPGQRYERWRREAPVEYELLQRQTRRLVRKMGNAQ
jgi:hypothetical protein